MSCQSLITRMFSRSSQKSSWTFTADRGWISFGGIRWQRHQRMITWRWLATVSSTPPPFLPLHFLSILISEFRNRRPLPSCCETYAVWECLYWGLRPSCQFDGAHLPDPWRLHKSSMRQGIKITLATYSFRLKLIYSSMQNTKDLPRTWRKGSFRFQSSMRYAQTSPIGNS